MRRVRFLAFTVAAALLTTGLSGQSGASIIQYYSSFEKRARRARTRTTGLRAVLLRHAGRPLAGATATVTSLSTNTSILEGSVTFGAASTGVLVEPTFTIRQNRSYTFKPSDLRWSIAVQTGNRPPVASGGADRTVPVGDVVTLFGGASSGSGRRLAVFYVATCIRARWQHRST